jgi:SNF2 family DNA or RNA helicase
MKLYNYQREDTNTLLRVMATRGGGLNLSDTGTGKTPSTITLIEELGILKDGYALIVMPKSILYNWQSKWADWYPNRVTKVITGVKFSREAIAMGMSKGEVGFVGYESFRLMEKIFTDNPPIMIVCDEAHRIKRRDTRIAQALKRVRNHVRYALALTATPIDAKPFELWSILNLLDPDTYGPKPRNYNGDKEFWPYWKWASKYCVWRQGRYTDWEYVQPNQDKMEELRQEIQALGVRRERREVLPFLPPTTFERVLLDATPEQRRMHQQLRKFSFTERPDGTLLITTNETSQLIRLLQVCDNPALVGGNNDSPKDDYVLELLESVTQIAVFSRFKQNLLLLSQKLEAAGHTVVWITGDESARERERSYTALNRGQADVCLCTYGAGGEGIDLMVSHMVMYDQPWSYIQWYQAISRPERPGTPHSNIIITTLNIRNSVEDFVYGLLNAKQDVSAQVLLKYIREEAA